MCLLDDIENIIFSIHGIYSATFATFCNETEFSDDLVWPTKLFFPQMCKSYNV